MAFINEFTKTFQIEDHSQVLIRKMYMEEYRIVCLTKHGNAYFSMDMEFDSEDDADLCYEKYNQEQAEAFYNLVTNLQGRKN